MKTGKTDIAGLNTVGQMVIGQMMSVDILEGGGDYHRLSKRSNDLMRLFVASLENEQLSSCNLMGLGARCMKYKCAIRDLTAGTICDFDVDQEDQIRAIIHSLCERLEASFWILIDAMEKAQNGID